jgi:DNA polymerase III alpha subunit
MKIDSIGQTYYSSDELVNVLYTNPDVDLSKFRVQDPVSYNASVELTYSMFELLTAYQEFTGSIEELDRRNQTTWYMPTEYFDLDIAQWVLDQCKTDAELQRTAEELLLFQERELFNLLRWLKYFVDTMRKHKVVWGVGRGSSVASYVLYLIGVHRINSMYYDLNIDEFLK